MDADGMMVHFGFIRRNADRFNRKQLYEILRELYKLELILLQSLQTSEHQALSPIPTGESQIDTQ